MKVDFYIAGTQKSGTTNLAYILSQSTNIVTHHQLECTYYWDKQEYIQGTNFLKKNYFFDTTEDELVNKKILLKHSNSYTNTDVLKRVYAENPDVIFLFIFRHPVQRFVSSYLMETIRSLYSLDLAAAVRKAIQDKYSFEYQVFLKYGEYDFWMEKILSTIPQKNIECFLFEELFEEQEQHLSDFAKKYQLNFNPHVLKDLEIKNNYKEYKNYWYQKFVVYLRNSKIRQIFKNILPISYWVMLTKKIENINLIEPNEKPLIDEQYEKILNEYYAESIERFEALMGLKTNWLKKEIAV